MEDETSFMKTPEMTAEVLVIEMTGEVRKDKWGLHVFDERQRNVGKGKRGQRRGYFLIDGLGGNKR
ncbi:hypothetical protein KIN20_005615 [Parelaphostrongylus tenuis]|uniref:Uncharacterized protein n=1 Tax=Parelaphostrongylus tenuis TaxID=148309 RepID=A0AAD5MLF3_PARTN|nr:hypothetical protein KIN20_005615 [Parelaphostrongylus tenuis]